MVKVIGLTGGIGSGKSTVACFLAELGAIIIDADKIGHQVLKENSEIRRQVVAAFGQQVTAADGSIGRKKLGKIVFSNAQSLSRLNQIMHPPIYKMVKAHLEEYRQRGVKVVVVEAPLLLEAGWTSLVDEVWVTVAPEDTVLRRLKEKWLSQKEALARLRSQMPAAERVKHAAVVIDTDCSLDELKVKVKEVWGRFDSQRQ